MKHLIKFVFMLKKYASSVNYRVHYKNFLKPVDEKSIKLNKMYMMSRHTYIRKRK